MVTKDVIRNSMEAKWRKHQVHLYLIIFAILVGTSAFVSIIVSWAHGDIIIGLFVELIVVLVFSVYFLPFIIYYMYQYFKLFKDLDNYIMYEVILNNPSTSFCYRGAIYYTVSFVTNSDERITMETKPLWSSTILSTFLLEDYNNKKINIVYNENNQKMIVIGLINI